MLHERFENFDGAHDAEKFPETFDALVVLGGGLHRPLDVRKSHHARLTLESKMRALAAGEMFQSGLVKKIIFSGGATAGKEFGSEANLMRAYLKKKFPEVPEDAVLLEEESFDTPENAEKVKEMLQQHGIGSFALLTNAFHLARAQKLFELQGLTVRGFPAEELLRSRGSRSHDASHISPHYQRFVDKYLGSKHQKLALVKEAILRTLLIIDANGNIPRFFTSRSRKRA